MEKQEVIEHLCETVALAYRSIGDYSSPSDGFCKRCEKHRHPLWNFEHSGITLKYVRQAVLEKLKADGYEIDAGFDAESGDPKE